MKTQIEICRVSYRCQTANEISAWFIPGGNVDSWVDEISNWNVPHHDIEILVVPRSKSDLSAAGMLAVGPVPPSEQVSSFCVPYKSYLEQVFVPIDAELFPFVGKTELARLIVKENTYIWHPTIGLVVAGADEKLSVSDLLVSPNVSDHSWDGAREGVVFSSRISFVKALVNPSVADVLRDGRDDIGEKAEDLKNIPKPRDGAGNRISESDLANQMLRPFAHLAKFVSGMVPEGGSHRTVFNSMQDWANRVLNNASESLLRRRNKELFRLMKMLEDDPDNGLKFALPMSGGGGRGLAPPGGSLSRNVTDFNLKSLFGGSGPTDYWDIPHEVRMRMHRQYRELAQREMNLGRYRRAAYIYAHLLGDYSASARALEEGHHFREAAVLYRERLQNIPRAIECLQSGGLWTEAIELCIEKERWEQAGDLYLAIEREEKAAECFDTAATNATQSGMFVEASRIYETKMHDVDRAIETLRIGFPNQHKVVPCVREMLRIQQENARNEETRDLLRSFCEESENSTIHSGVIELISGTAVDHPDALIRNCAHDTTTRIVSRMLKRDASQNVPRMLSAIARLAPRDKILRRDCSRFPNSELRLKRNVPSKPNAENSAKGIQVLETFQMSGKTNWQHAIGFRHGFVAVGMQDTGQLALVRSGWNGEGVNQVQKRKLEQLTSTSMNLIGDEHSSYIGLQLSGILDETIQFPETSNLPLLKVGPSPTDAFGRMGVAFEGPNRWCCVRWAETHLTIETVDNNGHLITSRFLRDLDHESDLNIDIKVFCNGRKRFVAVSGFDGGVGLAFNELIAIGRSDQTDVLGLDHEVVEIAGSARGTLSRIALAFEYGVQVVWDQVGSFSTLRICPESYRPKILFLRTGHLVVATNEEVEVFQTRNNDVVWVASKKLTNQDSELVALIRAKSSNHFATVRQNGTVTVYSVPSQ